MSQGFTLKQLSAPANGVGVVGSVFAIPQTDSTKSNQPAQRTGGIIGSRATSVKPLDRFIAGPENALAQIAASSVTDQWVRFNPLFFCGPSGVGKSHLLHCLLEASRRVYPELSSLWVTGADYSRAIANGLEVDALEDVRNTHRSVDILLIDGLHELDTKHTAQQELLHTIDYLVERDSQVVTSSRLPLDEFKSVLPVLTSRLAGGLQVPLVPPTGDTRQVILTELAEQHGVVVPNQIQEQLVSDDRRKRSKPMMVQDLLAAIAELNCAIDGDAQSSETTINRIVARDEATNEVTAKDINKRVAKYFNVTVRELTGNSRRKTVVRARALSVYLMRSRLGASFQLIGQHLGGRDHSTTMHAFQRAKEWLESDAGFARAAMEVDAALD